MASDALVPVGGLPMLSVIALIWSRELAFDYGADRRAGWVMGGMLRKIVGNAAVAGLLVAGVRVTAAEGSVHAG